MHALAPVHRASDVLPRCRGTAVERPPRFHSLGAPLSPTGGRAALLVAMCENGRLDLTRPGELAYVPRSAAGSLPDREFEGSCAVAVGGVAARALVAHPVGEAARLRRLYPALLVAPLLSGADDRPAQVVE